MKPLQTLWTVTRKFSRKILFHDFWSVKSYFQSIECSFQSVEQESSSDRHIQRLHDFFFTISIDWAKVSIDWKCLTLNFHLENSRTWIFTLTTLWNNIFQTQTSLLLQPILVYTYIYNNLPLGCNNIYLTWLIFYHA